MKPIASLNSDAAMKLAVWLKDRQIPYTTEVTTAEDSGLVFVEFMVEDPFLEEACTAAEAWQDDEANTDRAEAHWSCPACGSLNYRLVEDKGSSATLMACTNCDWSFALC